MSEVLPTLEVDSDLLCEGCIVGVQQVEVGVDILQPCKDAAGVGALQVVSLPLRIALKSLPPQSPPSVLHANIIKTSK